MVLINPLHNDHTNFNTVNMEIAIRVAALTNLFAGFITLMMGTFKEFEVWENQGVDNPLNNTDEMTDLATFGVTMKRLSFTNVSLALCIPYEMIHIVLGILLIQGICERSLKKIFICCMGYETSAVLEVIFFVLTVTYGEAEWILVSLVIAFYRFYTLGMVHSFSYKLLVENDIDPYSDFPLSEIFSSQPDEAEIEESDSEDEDDNIYDLLAKC